MLALVRILITPFLLIAYPAFAELQVTVLDVKEGQAILLSDNNKGVLIDTGHAGQAANVIKKLKHYGVSKLESIILTHLHPDHASGLFRLIEAYPNTHVFSNCHVLPDTVQPDMTRWVYEVLKLDKQHRCLSMGDELVFGNSRIKVLWPQEFVSHDLNHHSLVLVIEDTGKRFLLMGDVGIRAEAELIENNLLPAKIDTLVVGHHGAADATSNEFIKHIQPRRAVISVNANNIRGYPSQKVLQRLESHQIKVLRTDFHGDIRL